jgi:nucleolar protein 58
VAEKSLANSILKIPDLHIKPISDSSTTELFRAIRQHLPELIPGMEPGNFKEMSLGLSHSLSRHKLKFSPDKVDVMVVQAISLLDDLDKELNTYAMRVKEWYGWHFPELGKILNDNLAYARVILAMGMRSNAPKTDLAEILPEEIESAVKSAADISMGTEITEEDLENITLLAEQVVQYSEYRTQLSSYLESRMKAISPNMTELVGFLVGARLIAHAGSLMNLAKNPGSTVQILGAEKALFRALKTKHATPKYGLIYHASLVGQATGKNKGKIARQLASKVAIGVRVDALAEFEEDADADERAELGIASRLKIENNLRKIEGRPIATKGMAFGPNGQAAAAPSKWNVKEARKYNVDADGLNGDEEAADNGIKITLDRKPKRKLIEEVEDIPDVQMKDAPEKDKHAAAQNGFHTVPHSPTLSDVSDDTEDEPEEPSEQWQSEIQGATREAKKARKKERHERNVARAPDKAARKAERKAQEKRRNDREERRFAKAEQKKRRAAREADGPVLTTKPVVKAEAKTEAITSSLAKTQLSAPDYERLAQLAGLSVKKFTKRFDRGQITLNADGSLNILKSKDIKAQADDDEEAGTIPDESNGKKRKHREDGEEKPKKKKKHQRSADIEA